MKSRNKIEQYLCRICVLAISIWFVGCSDKVQFVAQSSTQHFVQDFIPEYVDIVWVLNNQSPMSRIRESLVSEGSRFFQRLDGIAHQYQMAFLTADMLVAQGRFQPLGDPLLLTKSFGTVESRTNIFANNIINNLLINVRTGGQDKGFESLITGLTQNTSVLTLRENVPLVVVMVSDSDDRSVAPSGEDPVDHYVSQLLSLKGNNPDLLRVYAINYTNKTDLCASGNISADILDDGTNGRPDTFEDRYFRFANALGGQTANLCGSFADDINLDGLRLEKLKTRFTLDQVPDERTLRVSVLMDGTSIETPPYRYESSTNEIIFEVAPIEGSTISVTYLPASIRE